MQSHRPPSGEYELGPFAQTRVFLLPGLCSCSSMLQLLACGRKTFQGKSGVLDLRKCCVCRPKPALEPGGRDFRGRRRPSRNEVVMPLDTAGWVQRSWRWELGLEGRAVRPRRVLDKGSRGCGSPGGAGTQAAASCARFVPAALGWAHLVSGGRSGFEASGLSFQALGCWQGACGLALL